MLHIKYSLWRLTLIAAISTLIFVSSAKAQVEKEYLVGYHQQPGSTDFENVKREGGKIKRRHQIVPVYCVSLTDAAVARLKKNPRVRYVVENQTVSLALPGVTAASEMEYNYPSWGAKRIHAAVAHANGINGNGVRIAVIDTGIDKNHPDLMANYAGGYDIINGDDNPMDDSFNSHGTHVAGIIGARLNDSGMVGVAPSASLYAVKVLDGSGFGTADTVIAGIQWAVSNGMHIANVSISGYHMLPLQQACDAAAASGVLIVAAAGNNSGGEVMYPAHYDSVVAVSAVDSSDIAAKFSAIGDAVELAAPGSLIYSTRAGGLYSNLSGTSQATAFVTGVAALLIQKGVIDVNGDGVVDTYDIRNHLQQTATDLGQRGKDPVYGYGLVDVEKALSTYNSNQMNIASATCANGTVDVAGQGFTPNEIQQPALQFFRAFLSKEEKKQAKLTNLYSAASTTCIVSSATDTQLSANCGICDGSIRVSAMNASAVVTFPDAIPNVTTNAKRIWIRANRINAVAGEIQEIRGRLLGQPQETSSVSLGQSTVEIIAWSENSVRFVVPNLPPGVYPLVVHVNGDQSNLLDFTIQ